MSNEKSESEKNQEAAKRAIGPNEIEGHSTTGIDSGIDAPDAPPSELEDEYTEGEDEQPASNLRQSHPNRNLDKPDLDKPAYS
jgi:hypothetical protein